MSIVSISRFIIAAVLAPAAAPAVLTLLQLLAGGEYSGLYLWVFFLGCAISYPVFYLLGVPAILVLHRSEDLTFGAVLLAGIICGVIFSVVLALRFGIDAADATLDSIKNILFGAISGLVVAIAFALIAGIRTQNIAKQQKDT